MNPFTGTPYECCGTVYTTPGTVRGQPAALWELLEHQTKEHQ